MSTKNQTNTAGKKFADTLGRFMTNEAKHTDGCEKRVSNMKISKIDNIITVKNNTMKTVLTITEHEDNQFSYLMRFVNATTLNRLLAVKEMLNWNNIELESEGGITYLKTTDGERITLNSGLFYSKEDLEEMSVIK